MSGWWSPAWRRWSALTRKRLSWPPPPGGTELHIGKLNLDGGELHVDGAIHTLLYEDKGPGPGQGGFLRRLFG